MKSSRGIYGLGMISTAYMLPLFALISPFNAQDAADITTTLPEPSTTTPPLLSLISELLLPHSTLHTASPTSRPSAPPLPVYPTTIPSPIPATSPHDTNVFNYYFLFLAALALLAIGLVWYFHVRRARRNHAQRVSGQRALARDIEGWAGVRRFGHGGRRREEGLDEDGEAPPPYMAKSEGGIGVVEGEVVVPLRAVVMDEARLPGYSVETRT
jgi:hypothetical protein